jgi:hypothetical protein
MPGWQLFEGISQLGRILKPQRAWAKEIAKYREREISVVYRELHGNYPFLFRNIY